jgi:hypothetical protein
MRTKVYKMDDTVWHSFLGCLSRIMITAQKENLYQVACLLTACSKGRIENILSLLTYLIELEGYGYDPLLLSSLKVRFLLEDTGLAELKSAKSDPKMDFRIAPRFEIIEGTPFELGQRIEIADLTDPHTLGQLTAGDEGFEDVWDVLGHKGVLEYYEYNCGCGQIFPDQPMMGVKLDNGMRCEFWAEEMKVA